MSELLMFGSHLDAAGVTRFLERAMATNVELQERGEDPVALCIWGTHGIGKTALVQEIAERNGWHFAYAAPAQFEEMGDLHGLPVVDGVTTRFAPPDWAPTAEGPGILLLDDFNRADDRILRGLMQLLQRSELVSWSLPPKWQIVTTANPEGGDYSVTPMDDAMLTRLLHVTLIFDARVWARWATDAGVDPRGISFVLTYPEIVNDARTTPRSLTQFFQHIKPIEDLVAEADLVQALAMSTLDPESAVAFQAFVNDGLDSLVEPEDILNAEDFTEIETAIERAGADEHGVRLDRLNTISTRLYLMLTAAGYEPAERHGPNLIRFMTLETLPNDLRVMLHRDLVTEAGPAVVEMLRDPKLADLALAAL